MTKDDSKILNLFSDYLAREIPLEDFQEQIALAHWSVEDDAPELCGLVYPAVGKLSEFARGHRTEDSLRKDLATAIRPFALRDMRESPPRPLLLDLTLEFGSIRKLPSSSPIVLCPNREVLFYGESAWAA